MSRPARSLRWLCLLPLLGLLLTVASAQADEPPRQWAVLIGVQKHANPLFNLHFPTNDVLALRKVLVERAALPAERILQLADLDEIGKENKARLPTLANLRRELPAFLAKVGKNDRVLVFFSGHGIAHKGQTYLVPRDFDAKAPADSGLPITELRSALKDCKAPVKFLLLDCCHAGNDRAPGDASLDAEKVARSLGVKEVPGCVVLASCRADEKSYEWPGRKQGVFTYWLCRALEAPPPAATARSPSPPSTTTFTNASRRLWSSSSRKRSRRSSSARSRARPFC
jgi:uncharacterized caspase-like protein